MSAALEAPAASVPASQPPLSAMMRCVLPVVFRNTTVWPDGTDAGFGEKAWLPELLTMPIAILVWGGVVTGGETIVDGLGAVLLRQATRLEASVANNNEQQIRFIVESDTA